MSKLHSRRWVTVLLLTLGLVGIAIAAVDHALVSDMADCPLGLELERSSSELIAQRDFPPLVACRYYYREGSNELYPPETVTRDAAISTAIGAVAVLMLGVGVVRIIKARTGIESRRGCVIDVQ